MWVAELRECVFFEFCSSSTHFFMFFFFFLTICFCIILMKKMWDPLLGIRLEGTCYMSREGERMCVFVFVFLLCYHISQCQFWEGRKKLVIKCSYYNKNMLLLLLPIQFFFV